MLLKINSNKNSNRSLQTIKLNVMNLIFVIATWLVLIAIIVVTNYFTHKRYRSIIEDQDKNTDEKIKYMKSSSFDEQDVFSN